MKVLQDFKSTAYLLTFRKNSMIFKGSPNSLKEFYLTVELRLGGGPNSPVNSPVNQDWGSLNLESLNSPLQAGTDKYKLEPGLSNKN